MVRHNHAAEAIQAQIEQKKERRSLLVKELEVLDGVIEALVASKKAVEDGSAVPIILMPKRRGRRPSAEVDARAERMQGILREFGPLSPTDLATKLTEAEGFDVTAAQVQDILRRRAQLFVALGDGRWAATPVAESADVCTGSDGGAALGA